MRKVQLMIKQEEVAPATTSDLVLMNNGRTLKEELSTHPLDKFSSTQTVTTSIEKIADGAYGGVYESGVMYGRTLVNLADLFSFDEDVTTSYNYVDRTVCETSKLKLNTSYLFIFKPNVSSNLNDYTTFEIGLGNSINHVAGHPSTVEGFRGYEIKHNQWNYIKMTFTDFKDYKYLAVRPLRTDNPDSTKPITYNVKEGLVVLEYQEGMENWDIPYFEGICDVKMPILRNVGKNLFDINGDINQKFDNLIVEVDNALIGNGGFVANNYTYQHHGKGMILKLKPNTTYTISGRVENYGAILIHSRTQVNIFNKQFLDTTFSCSYTTTSTTELCFAFATNGDSTTPKARFFDVQIEESPSPTTYENHKTNILHTPSEVTLRSLPNGVKDTLNVMTGEYVQRIGEVVLNGSENWSMDTNGGGATRFYNNMCTDISIKHGTVSSNENLICDKFPHPITNIWMDTRESVQVVLPNGLYFIFNNAQSVIQWKEYLSQNPVTIQYELAEPVITIVELIGTPFAYTDGHVILESGFEGQSLLPELSYSVPASKNGVISTTSKAILSHEQRLHKFEDLLLRESILMDYRLTLSFLNKM